MGQAGYSRWVTLCHAEILTHDPPNGKSASTRRHRVLPGGQSLRNGNPKRRRECASSSPLPEPVPAGGCVLPSWAWDRWVCGDGIAAGGRLRSQARHDWRCMAVKASEAYVLLRAKLEVWGTDPAPSSGLGMRKAGGAETGWSCCSGWRRGVCGRIFKDQWRAAPSPSCCSDPRRCSGGQGP